MVHNIVAIETLFINGWPAYVGLHGQGESSDRIVAKKAGLCVNLRVPLVQAGQAPTQLKRLA